jgi:P-type E1-E2 ATPase
VPASLTPFHGHTAPRSRRAGERQHGFVKGAPERVLSMCGRQAHGDAEQPIDPAYWHEQVEAMASRGQRLLAVARKPAAAGEDRLDFNDVQHGLAMLSLLGIIDPPREAAIRAVEHCHNAGIRVVMITGDHALTARAIGAELGIGDGNRALTAQISTRLTQA